MSIDEFLKILQGLLTPIIAVVATYIAYQQWRTNQNKWKFDRYERRLEVYKEVVRFISIGIREAKYSNAELMSFRPNVSEADFLFGKEVLEYINELHKKAVKLSYWNGEYRDSTQPRPENYNHNEVVEEMHKELNWIASQLEPARKLFKKYLDISK